MTKSPNKKPAGKAATGPADKTGVMAALHPEPKSTAAGHPGAKTRAKTRAKTGSKGAAGRKG